MRPLSGCGGRPCKARRRRRSQHDVYCSGCNCLMRGAFKGRVARCFIPARCSSSGASRGGARGEARKVGGRPPPRWLACRLPAAPIPHPGRVLCVVRRGRAAPASVPTLPADSRFNWPLPPPLACTVRSPGQLGGAPGWPTRGYPAPAAQLRPRPAPLAAYPAAASRLRRQPTCPPVCRRWRVPRCCWPWWPPWPWARLVSRRGVPAVVPLQVVARPPPPPHLSLSRPALLPTSARSGAARGAGEHGRPALHHRPDGLLQPERRLRGGAWRESWGGVLPWSVRPPSRRPVARLLTDMRGPPSPAPAGHRLHPRGHVLLHGADPRGPVHQERQVPVLGVRPRKRHLHRHRGVHDHRPRRHRCVSLCCVCGVVLVMRR